MDRPFLLTRRHSRSPGSCSVKRLANKVCSTNCVSGLSQNEMGFALHVWSSASSISLPIILRIGKRVRTSHHKAAKHLEAFGAFNAQAAGRNSLCEKNGLNAQLICWQSKEQQADDVRARLGEMMHLLLIGSAIWRSPYVARRTPGRPQNMPARLMLLTMLFTMVAPRDDALHELLRR